MVLWKPGAYEDIFGGLERLKLEQEMDSLEHSLRQPDFENKERSRGWGLEVVSAVF